MPQRICIGCGQTYDMRAAPGQRCPACQAKLNARRGTTAQRGYGADHQRERRRQLSQFTPGDPCARCGKPMWDPAAIDLDHTKDRTGYRGLAHAACNRGDR